MPPPPLRLPLSIYQVRDWSIEIVTSTWSGAESLNVGIRFNHEKDVWIFAQVESLEEANDWLCRIEEGQVTLEEIMATPHWGLMCVPQDPALSHLAQGRIIRSIAFIRPFTEPGHWSVVPMGTNTLIPRHVDVGVRLDHAEHVLLFAQVLSLKEAICLLADVAMGELTVQEILSKPKLAVYRMPEGEHELSGPLTSEKREERVLEILWTLQCLEEIRDWENPEKVKAREEERQRILEMHLREQARILEEYNRHMARLTETLLSASTQEALDKPETGEDTTSPSPLPSLCQIPTTPGILLESSVVRHYVKGSSPAFGQTVSGGPPTILECWAMMSKTAEEKLHNWIAEDDRPIIYVKLQGPFLIGRLGAIVERAEEVFDAQTGDLLMWGVTD